MLQTCCDKLRGWIRVAPYQAMQEFDDEDEDFDTSKGLRIMSIAYKTERLELITQYPVITHNICWRQAFGGDFIFCLKAVN